MSPNCWGQLRVWRNVRSPGAAFRNKNVAYPGTVVGARPWRPLTALRKRNATRNADDQPISDGVKMTPWADCAPPRREAVAGPSPPACVSATLRMLGQVVPPSLPPEARRGEAAVLPAGRERR